MNHYRAYGELAQALETEIIASGRLLHCADGDAVAEFEMLTLSYYQKLFSPVKSA